MLEIGGEICTYSPTADIVRQQNEINRMTDSPQVDFDRVKEKIFKLAEMKYDCCDYNDSPQKTDEIKALLDGHEQLNILDISLFKACVSRIWISYFCAIEVEFVNGVRIKNITEQGRYSSKYALTELLICGKCGTFYRRTTWAARGKKQVVWRCISRLEHGKKYCPDSPTIKEELLHNAIIRAINSYYSCRDDIVKILKANIGSVLECQGEEEIHAIEKRLKEIDSARNDLVGLIASGGCDEDKLDSEFAKLYSEEQQLSERLTMLKSQNQTSAETQSKLDKIMDMIEHEKFELETFDNVLIRKLIECVKVLCKTEILVIFKGGYEVRAEIE